ncbi:MAG: carboxypeptidase regulatory-like domain-containing protein [Gemmatimonadales bacterium]
MVSALARPPTDPPKRRLIALVVMGLMAVGSADGRAQTVIVRTVEVDSKRPIGGAIVSLVDQAERRVVQGLTNESGRLVLKAVAPGTFRLRADRIGHPGIWSEFFELRDTVTIEVAMPLERVTLPELTVRASSACEPRADGAETAGLWEEIRKALSAGEITAATQSVELSVRRFRRYRTLHGAVRADSTLREYRTRASPFVSPAPASLRSEGYVREVGGGYQFHGPDAPTLLSTDFLESHCFELARPSRELPNAIGLGFRPTKDVKLPDVRGVLWVDRATGELQRLDFEFVNAPSAVRAPGIGGRVEFARLATGAWIVRDWYLRAPDRIGIERRGGRRTDRTVRDSVVGYVDEGGVARPVGDLTIALGEAAGRVQAATTVAGDFRGRVVAPDGTPIPGALVAVAETDTVLATNDEGRFEVTQLPVGRLSVRIRAIGFRPLGAVFTLGSGRRLVDTTIVLQRAAQLLDSVVVTAKAPGFVAGKMIDVERRRASGFGRFLTRAQLQDPLLGGLNMQLRTIGRMLVAPLCGGKGYGAASSTRGEPPVKVNCGDYKLRDCFMAVYVDGALYWSPDMGDIRQPPDLSTFNPLHYETVEIYRSVAELPIEYAGPAAGCGVLLLWTRVG